MTDRNRTSTRGIAGLAKLSRDEAEDRAIRDALDEIEKGHAGLRLARTMTGALARQMRDEALGQLALAGRFLIEVSK